MRNPWIYQSRMLLSLDCMTKNTWRVDRLIFFYIVWLLFPPSFCSRGSIFWMLMCLLNVIDLIVSDIEWKAVDFKGIFEQRIILECQFYWSAFPSQLSSSFSGRAKVLLPHQHTLLRAQLDEWQSQHGSPSRVIRWRLVRLYSSYLL